MKKYIASCLILLFSMQIFSWEIAYAKAATTGKNHTKILKKSSVKQSTWTRTPAIESKKNTIPSVDMAKVPDYQEITLIATAYYSPLPDQKYYLRNNHQEEILLNGNGVYGASGKPVFNGMLAAPKSYGFGTKIWVEGFGIGSVEDRGGAIVPTGIRWNAYDRIDIWMGFWEEGLARALAWGRRTVKARIYVSNKVTVTFDFTKIKPVNLSKSIAKAVKDSKVTLSGAEGEKNAAQIGSKTNLAVVKPDELDIKMKAFEHEKLRVKKIIDAFGTLQLGDVGPQIRSLQEILIEMGYLKSKSTAIYWPATQSAVAEFQKSTGLIIDSKDPNAGIFGKFTRAKLVDEVLYKGIEV